MFNPIEDLLDEFDFNKVHRVMQALNWRWAGIDGVPEVPDLRRQARDLLRHIAEAKNVRSVSTGGFTAYMHDGLLGLRFEVSAYEIEIEKGIGQ